MKFQYNTQLNKQNETENKKKTQHTALSQIPRFCTTFNVNTDFRVRERIPTGCAFTGGSLKQLLPLVSWRWKRVFYWMESGSGCRYRGREKVCQTPTGIENQCFTWNRERDSSSGSRMVRGCTLPSQVNIERRMWKACKFCYFSEMNFRKANK